MIAGLLLAAGGSARFGGRKLLHPIAGRPMLRWSAEALAAAVDELVVVVGERRADVDDALAGIAARVVVNDRAGEGMATSIAVGVSALGPGADAVLIALADEPQPSRHAASLVLERFAAERAAIVAPLFRGIPGHPVLFARAVFPELLRLHGDRGARAVVERDPRRVATVAVDEPPPVDVDTPADLARLTPGR